MARNYYQSYGSSYGSRGGSSWGAGGSRTVSDARLHQKSGASNGFGGYAKISNPEGSFQMRKTGK